MHCLPFFMNCDSFTGNFLLKCVIPDFQFIHASFCSNWKYSRPVSLPVLQELVQPSFLTWMTEMTWLLFFVTTHINFRPGQSAFCLIVRMWYSTQQRFSSIPLCPLFTLIFLWGCNTNVLKHLQLNTCTGNHPGLQNQNGPWEIAATGNP